MPGNYLNLSKGARSWLLTLDHKRIGLLYLAAITFSFIVGGLFAVGMGTQHLAPQGDEPGLITANGYNIMFSVHGTVMILLVIIPGIPATLGNFLVPIMLGARNVVFPRLNLVGFYLFALGAAFVAASLFGGGGVDTGWTFYTPYSIAGAGTKVALPVYLALGGACLISFSSILTGLNFMVTIHMLRPPWMTWFRIPVFLWGIFAVAIVQLLATPVLAITVLLLIAENAIHLGIFDPALAGNPVLFQHFFWFSSHPAVYVMILPAFGIVSELVSVHSRKHIFGYRAIVYSLIAISMLSLLVWGTHMFTSNMSPVSSAIFSLLSFSVTIPALIAVVNLLATMRLGSIQLNTPMLWALGFIFNFCVGGLSWLYFATISTNVFLHDTTFEVAHFHYVVMGGVLFALLGGVFHWWPKIVGRMVDDRLGRMAFWTIFVGFNLAFLPQFVMGSEGMPRRYFDYNAEYTLWQVLSTCGTYVQGIGFVVAGFCLLRSLKSGRVAPANPWGGNTLEWHCSSPPPIVNFERAPAEVEGYSYRNLTYDEEAQGYVSAS